MPAGRSHAATERLATNLLTWSGSLLVVGSSVIHYYLWDSQGYRHIPTIGPLFITQAVVGVVLAVVTSAVRNPLLAAAEAGLAFSSAGGLIISVNFGLFGWQESMSAPYAGLALGVEIAAGALLIVAAAIPGRLWLANWRSRHDATGGARASVGRGLNGTTVPGPVDGANLAATDQPLGEAGA
jgi:hypothetical protein